MARNPIAILGIAFLIMSAGVYGVNDWVGRQIKEAGDFRSFGMKKVVNEAPSYYREEAVPDSIEEDVSVDILVPKAEEPKIKKIIYELPLDELSFLK